MPDGPTLEACPRDRLTDELRALLSRQSGIPSELIGEDRPIGPEPGGLDLDSLDRIELAIIIGRRAHMDIPDEHVDWRELGTLGGLVDYIDRRNRGYAPTRCGGRIIWEATMVPPAPPRPAPLPLEGQ